MSACIAFVELPLVLAQLGSGLFSARALGVSLWVGLALLTLSLLVLMWTRWGQARPLSKCMALSVLAHVLLIGYAYGTKLFFEAPTPVVEDFIRLTIDPDQSSSAENDDGRSMAPWDQFAVENFDAPVLEVSERQPTTDSPATRSVKTTRQPSITVTEGDLPQAAESHLPSTAQPSPVDALHVGAPVINPTKIVAPQVRRRADEVSVAPEIRSPQRVEPALSADLPAKRNASQNLPISLFDPLRPLQRMSDVKTDSPAPDALADVQDQLLPSGNRTTDAPQQQVVSSKQSPDAWVSLGAAASDATASPATPNGATQADRLATNDGAGVPRRLGDGQELPGVYRSRITNQRLKTARRFGGNEESEAAVDAALIWLAAQQSTDGRWRAGSYGAGRETNTLGHHREGAGARADTGITGLALLAFLARGHSHLEGKYRGNVLRGLEFLIHSQSSDGNLAGEAKLYAMMYCHGMASLALSETFAITGDQQLGPYVEQAVSYSINSQHASGGGWRYQPSDQGDMSQFGWQVMALRSAELAGVNIPDRTHTGMRRFLARCSSGQHGGLASYRPGERTSRTMTAEALTCRFFLQSQDDANTVREAADFVSLELPKAGEPNLYYWYYGTLAMFQMQNDQWKAWNEALQRQLLGRQRSQGPLAGSWDADSTWGSYGGRIYATAMATLCLEVYYRYLPLYHLAHEQE